MTDSRSRKSCQSGSRQRQKPLAFGRLEGKSVEADFSGGALTSDAGLLLVRQVDRQFGITEKFAQCFEDWRAANRGEGHRPSGWSSGKEERNELVSSR